MNIDNVVEELREEKARIEAAIAALEGSTGRSRNGRGKAANGVRNGRRRGKTRRLSAAAKKRISEAAKARWAKAKKAGKNRL